MPRESDGREAFLRASRSVPERLPVSTYRLQFNRGFTFRDAMAIAGYLDALGVTDIYCSPYFKAKAGSTHGYDIIDHRSINPEVGTEEDFSLLCAELRGRGMGLIMDIVPNHMSIASSRNAWWQDVLENGQASPHASYFDIDWKPVREVLEGKVILPILGDQYGRVLENQELRLSFGDGAFFILYYDHRLPLDPSTYPRILTHRQEELEDALGAGSPEYQEFLSIVTALRHLPDRTEEETEKVTERLREKEIIKKRLLALHEECPPFRDFIAENARLFNGAPGVPGSFDLLDGLLDAQVYRLSYWQVAIEEINYRRFFDINDLAAIRTEDPAVFVETHRMLLGHIEEKKITGLRVDHPDGLHNPREYLMRLQEECFVRIARAALGVGEEDPEVDAAIRDLYQQEIGRTPSLRTPFYIIGEKILTDGERLPEEWPLFGTTGYVFMNSVNGLFVNQEGARALTNLYSRFTRSTQRYPDLVYEKKRLIMESSMSSEINMLGHTLNRISESDRHSRDFTLNSLTAAIVEVIAFFPVYRTYADSTGVTDRDVRYIEAAISRARRHRRDLSGSIFDFLKDVLTLRFPEHAGEETRRQWLDFTLKFQQMTGPVMAKGLEDTVFYSFNRLVSLNEVGGNPDRFGTRLEVFHGQNIDRTKHWSHTMVATSTHDSKRSEDVRARINVLSELPDEWKDRVTRWGRMNRKHKTLIEGHPAPDRNDEFLIYQTLLGAWPMEEMHGPAFEAFLQRIKDYMLKAAKEAKTNTTWISPNEEYENALLRFVEGILGSRMFLEDFRPFQRKLHRFGMFNSLSQTLLKITSPGVPDFYQGTELWNLTLVDPDNRRPVDFGKAEGMLRELLADNRDPVELCRELLGNREDGRIKLHVTCKALNFRKKFRRLFLDGKYVPLSCTGEHDARVVSFMYDAGDFSCITVAPRLLAGILREEADPLGPLWSDTLLLLPPEKAEARYRDVFTGRTLHAEAGQNDVCLAIADVFSDFPVALLEEMPSR